MTRNNLDSHISWLLSSEVTPPVGVQVGASTNSATVIESGNICLLEENLEEEDSRAALIPIQNRPTSQTVDARFVRPPIPPSIAPKTQQRESSQTSGNESMGKLASAQRSTRPGLMSQHQLATPTPTTTSTAAPSSLRQGYANLLRENSGTPSSKPFTDRLLPRSSRSVQTPQTPRQTPRPTIELKIETVESVDLTGDSYGEGITSRSSSTEITFSEPTVLWREDSASRAEPLVKTSKKRKSDELPKNSPKEHHGCERSAVKARRIEHASLDEFMDIDDMITSQQSEHLTPHPRMVQPSIEVPLSEADVEEYQVTETISRVETRTRKSISRVPSVSDGGHTRQKYPHPNQSIPCGTPTKLRPLVQVARSPTPKTVISPVPEYFPTPQKHQKRQQEMTIQDSEDDDDEMNLEEAKRASCSPHPSVKNSPLVIDMSKGPKWQEIPEFDFNALKDTQDTRPRVASPLRPISMNAATKQDCLPLPFLRGSPTKASPASKPLNQLPSQPTPPSTLTVEDKAVVNRYLGNPSAINLYSQRITNLKDQNAIASMVYSDVNEVPPQHLKEERMALLVMEKAYNSLELLAGRHRSLMTEKKGLARKICELLDLDLDASVQEEGQAAITRELRVLEKDVWHLLHTSGAIKDGFGTGADSEAYAPPPKSSSKPYEGVAPLPSGSSTIGSAQIILQTQFPSLQQISTSSHNQYMTECLPPRSSPRRDLAADSVARRYPSPSPLRRPAPSALHAEPAQLPSPKIDGTTSKRGIKQPNFYRDPSPVDYGLDNDFDFDDILMREAELQNNSYTKDDIPDEIEDDYGDSDEDGLLEFAQEIEKRQSLPESLSVSTRKISHDASRNLQSQKHSTMSKKTMYSHVDPAHASMLNHPWSADVKKALRDRFGLRGFRQNQLDAINATLAGKDAFILMPTGGGKSLCYQLPAVIQSGKTRGVTIVISPLLSLMSDQVDHLKKRHIQAFLLNGEKAKEERDLVYNALREPFPDQFVQVLYITPEMIGKSKALMNALGELHRKKKLARIVIDEAHCVSQWGHDFRPDYKTLVNVRHSFPGVPFMALTATATENVKADCIHNLGMKGCEEYKQSFNRPNLHYEIRPKKGKGASAAVLESMADLILNDYKNQTGIVYTLSRKGCEDLAQKLQDKGIKAHHFHASMPPEEKTQVQRDWQAGVWQVVVATIAFGMGIDKPDVRFVIHHTLPKSLEGYYQETGRAGRDGKPSGCYLFYGYQDTAVLKRFIDESEGDDEVKERQREMLNRMVQFCENRCDCRRADILAYFGEAFSKEDCNNSCDNCNSDAVFEPMDVTSQAGAALRIVQKLQRGNVTLLHVLDILRGSTASKIKSQNHDKIEGHGCASDLPRSEVERLFTRLLMENALVEYNVVNKVGFATQYIQLGPNYRDFITGRRKLRLMHKVSGSPAGGMKPTARKRPGPPPSTMLTSPVSASSRRQQNKNRTMKFHDEETDDDDNLVSEGHESEDAFEPVRHPGSRQERRAVGLGPPITTDDRMKDLPELHRATVHQFVAEAKKLEEQIRNRNGNSKPYFTETDFREMAINWTLSLDDMREITGIDQDKVSRHGNKFISLIEQFHNNYDEMMNHNDNRDMDQNHVNVIDLCSDDETTEAEDNNDVSQIEQPSKYFTPASVRQFNKRVAEAQLLPQTRHEKPDPPKQSSRGNHRGKSRNRGGGSRRGSGRRSNGSASGSNTSRPRSGGFANSGVAKKASSSRRSSASSKKTSTSMASKSSNMGAPFANPGGRGGGGSGSGGIPPMPT